MHEKTNSKWISGPGGINCPCCHKGSKKDAKKGDSRHRRREGKKLAIVPMDSDTFVKIQMNRI